MAKRRNGNAADETTCRVKRATVARLRAAVAQIVAGVEAGRMRDPGVDPEPANPQCLGLSMDAMIVLLLDARDRHNEAAARQRAARSKQMPQVEGEV